MFIWSHEFSNKILSCRTVKVNFGRLVYSIQTKRIHLDLKQLIFKANIKKKLRY